MDKVTPPPIFHPEDKFRPFEKFHALASTFFQNAFQGHFLLTSEELLSFDIRTNDIIWLILWTLAITYATFTIIYEFRQPFDLNILLDRERRRRDRWEFWGKFPWRWLWPFRNDVLDAPSQQAVPHHPHLQGPWGAYRLLLDVDVWGPNAGYWESLISAVLALKVFFRLVIISSWEDLQDEIQNLLIYYRRIGNYLCLKLLAFFPKEEEEEEDKVAEPLKKKSKKEELGHENLLSLVQEDPIIPTFGKGKVETFLEEPKESKNVAPTSKPKAEFKSNHTIKRYLFLPPDHPEGDEDDSDCLPESCSSSEDTRASSSNLSTTTTTTNDDEMISGNNKTKGKRCLEKVSSDWSSD